MYRKGEIFMINAITNYTYRERMYAEVVYPLHKVADSFRWLNSRLSTHLDFYSKVSWDTHLKDDTFILLFKEGLNFMHTDLEGIVSFDLRMIISIYQDLLSELHVTILDYMPETNDLQDISNASMELLCTLCDVSKLLQEDNPDYGNVCKVLAEKLIYLDIIFKLLYKIADEILNAFSYFGLTSQKDYAKALKNRTKLKDIYGSKMDSFDNIKTNKISTKN